MENTVLKVVKVERRKRLYEQIAEQIERLVREQGLPAGSKLPSERELAESLGVGRPSLREAMIALEMIGLIEVRVGEGTFVAEQPKSKKSFSFINGYDLGPGLLDQFEARRVIEIACVAKASQRASQEDIEELVNCLQEIKNAIEKLQNPNDIFRRFHVSLARISGNLIYLKMVEELWDLREQPMWDMLRKKVESLRSWELGLETRRRLIDCLRTRDEKGARREIENHFNRVEHLYFGEEAN
ncbi:MAG: FadR family transcriptional regulator [SAR324 cluster bacterium]|nr:FadR family transcriptional regulator [SAR324 cluster bacterium]